jgi:hypothetical protein
MTPYYIDGRFVDTEAEVAELGKKLRADAALNLIADLQRTRPRLIVDVYSSIHTLPPPALVEFIRANYRDLGAIGPNPERPFRVLELVEPTPALAEIRVYFSKALLAMIRFSIHSLISGSASFGKT